MDHVLLGGQVVYRVHEPGQCKGQYCTIHNWSPHPMQTWTQVWDGSTMWRVCPSHGEVHPDPDDQPPNAWLDDCQCRCCELTPAQAAREIIQRLPAPE